MKRASSAQYFPVTSVELIQPPGSTPALFNLSLSTSSLSLLNAILHGGSSGKRIATITLVVRSRGHGRGSITTQVIDTFREGFVTSFDESLSGSFTGQVALRAGGSTKSAASGH